MIEDTPKKLYTGSVYRGILSLEGSRWLHGAHLLLANFMTLSKEDFMAFSRTIFNFKQSDFTKLILEFDSSVIKALHKDASFNLNFMFDEETYTPRWDGYQFDHPAMPGISIHKVKFDSVIAQYYLVINYEKSTQGSMYDYSLTTWSELVRETIKTVSATGGYKTIAAPLVYLPEFCRTIDGAIEFHNHCYSRMAKTPEVKYAKEQVTSGMSLDYVNITVTRK